MLTSLWKIRLPSTNCEKVLSARCRIESHRSVPTTATFIWLKCYFVYRSSGKQMQPFEGIGSMLDEMARLQWTSYSWKCLSPMFHFDRYLKTISLTKRDCYWAQQKRNRCRISRHDPIQFNSSMICLHVVFSKPSAQFHSWLKLGTICKEKQLQRYSKEAKSVRPLNCCHPGVMFCNVTIRRIIRKKWLQAVLQDWF